MTKIMSPAGSFESLQAAIQGGADSVYFGIEQLNMRARAANNFTLSDLAEIKKICSEKNVKTYLTLNTVMYDHDIMLMKKIIDAAKKNNIDAVIASDHAALMHAKKIGMPIHISTQANVSNIESVRFFADYADTIVLARELTLNQVADVVKQIKRQKIKGPSGKLIKIEVFAHGALCMAVSGKCYLSLHSHNASANRGACIQNCRREYIVQDKENEVELEIDNEYIMSSKDLCTIDFIDKLIETGMLPTMFILQQNVIKKLLNVIIMAAILQQKLNIGKMNWQQSLTVVSGVVIFLEKLWVNGAIPEARRQRLKKFMSVRVSSIFQKTK